MRNFIFTTILVLFPLIGASAQSPQHHKGKSGCSRTEMMEKFMAEKQTYIKDCIAISDEVAEQFFSLYKEMEKKKFEVSFELFKKVRELRRSNTNLSDAEYMKYADELSALPAKIATIQEEYYNKYKEILSAKQLFLFFQCEQEFGKSMMRGSKHADTNK